MKVITLSLSAMVSTTLVKPALEPVMPVSRKPTVRSTLVAPSSVMATAKVFTEVSPLAQLNRPLVLV